MGMRFASVGRRRLAGRYRRTKMTAVVSLGALGATVLLAPSGFAQESTPETGEIRNGTAKAVAVVAKIAPGVGNLELGMTAGTAVAQVTNNLAQATSQTGDLGLIGSSLTSEGCGGSSTIQPDQLPQPTSVDNRGGDASVRRDEGGSDGFAAGRMQVEATEDAPASRARTTTASLGETDVVEIGGGTSEAIARVLPGEGRESLATVTSSVDLGGVLQLEGMRWRAHHRTGVEPLAEGSFEVGRANAGGIPIPTEDLGVLEDGINTVLAQTGVSISLPEVRRIVDPADLIRVTPLRIELRDSPAGKTLLGPILDVTRDQRVELFDSLVAAACDLAGVLLVGDVGISVLAGTGFLTVEIGGVEAASSDLEIGNPFGDFTPVLSGDATPDLSGALPTPDPGVPASGAAPGGLSPPSTVPAAAGPAPQQGLPTRPTSAVVELCESLHPNGDDCSEGAAAAVGAVGVLATIGMAGADALRQRRRAELEEI